MREKRPDWEKRGSIKKREVPLGEESRGLIWTRDAALREEMIFCFIVVD